MNIDIKGEELSKNYLMAFYPHIACVFMQNLEFVALKMSENLVWTWQTDGQTDMAKSIFLVALIKNIYTL